MGSLKQGVCRDSNSIFDLQAIDQFFTALEMQSSGAQRLLDDDGDADFSLLSKSSAVHV